MENKSWLTYFYEISAIPRASYKEEKIAAYLMEFSRTHNLEAYTDETHNVLICKKASQGYESEPILVLQGHTDMVCEKNAETAHDFDHEGIHIIREGDTLRADGTTLGADNGYAVATMLAILADDSLPHPALECLFTTSEEVGMDGMRSFDKSRLHGRRMLNLDSCEENSATAACAGGVRTHFHRHGTAESRTGTAVCLTVSGLSGGHSGEDIHRRRGNALKVAARILSAAQKAALQIVSLEGGSKDNAIPRECTAVVFSADAAQTMQLMQREAETIAAELRTVDGGFRFAITAEERQAEVMSEADSSALLALLRILPCGVISMSADIPGLVESSSNTAIVHAAKDEAEIIISSRSSVDSRLDDICALMETCAACTGFSCTHVGRYPGWDFNRSSQMQKIYQDASRAVLGTAGEIIGIHAGLECGLLSREIPDMDMISIGPNMADIHTPAEKLSISSGDRVYNIVLHILAARSNH